MTNDFIEVIKVLEIPHLKKEQNLDNEKYSCTWNGLNISYTTNSDYYVIEDKENNSNVSLELANIINKKDKNNNYEIYLEKEEGQTKEKVYISTKEGLLMFILESQDYYARKFKLPEIYVKQYEELYNKILINLIKKINPSYPIKNWMKDNVKNYKENTYEIYLKSLDIAKESPINKNIREALNNFNKAVNPFQNETIDTGSLTNLPKHIKFGVISHKDYDIKQDNCAEIYFFDLKTENYITFSRFLNGFCYSLEYQINDKETIRVTHSLGDWFDEDETIKICTNDFEITYFIIKNLIHIDKISRPTKYGIREPITLEQKQFILDKLIEATQYANTITIDNLKNNISNKRKTLKKD